MESEQNERIQAPIFVVSKQQRTNNFFQMACKGIDPIKRRNIPKYVIRKLINYVLDYTGDAFQKLKTKCNIDKDQYIILVNNFERLKISEKKRLSHSCRKDYTSTINKIILNPRMHLLLNFSLKNTLENYDKEKYLRISKDNLELHQKCITALFNYSESLIASYPPNFADTSMQSQNEHGIDETVELSNILTKSGSPD